MPFRVALAVYVIFFAALVIGLKGQWDLNHRLCEETQLNRGAIRDALKRGFGNLGYRYDDELERVVDFGPKGEPLVPLAYYRDHPQERKRIRRQLEQELEFFAPIAC